MSFIVLLSFIISTLIIVALLSPHFSSILGVHRQKKEAVILAPFLKPQRFRKLFGYGGMSSETDNLTSRKAELLRSIARGIVEGLVSEMILENFEAVEKFDRALRGNSAASGSVMSAAYCAVAVECTVKLLVAGGGKAVSKYWNAFDRIWNLRIGELERLGGSDLVTEEVKKWRDELRSSFGDHEACVKLCGVNTRNEAVSRVRVYLEEEGKSMGLSLLESEGVRKCRVTWIR